MADKIARRPVGNFFIKKSIQITIIVKILAIVTASTVITTLILAAVYHMKSQGGSFYYMSDNIMEDLKLQSILGIMLPAVITAQTVGLLAALGTGLFSSRKVAVPLYKIERWAYQIKNGKLRTRLAFREEKQMHELMEHCNSITDTYGSIFCRIDELVCRLEKASQNAEAVSELRKILEKIDFRDT